MSKENPTQPLFNFARAALDEYEKQAERWIEYGMQHAQEGAKIVRTLRAQLVGTGKNMLDTVEQLARSVS